MRVKRLISVGVVSLGLVLGTGLSAQAVSDDNSASVPGGGTITSNIWRGSLSSSGNTYRWDYQVSAVYSGAQTVTSIRTKWTLGACMQNSASFTIGVSVDGFTVGAGSSWTCGDVTAYWTNTNGAKSSSWRSTAVAAPSKYYQSNSIWGKNVARVYTKGYAQPKEVTASV
ncbi:hypothetical protein [Cellulomonas persica]|uniref:hypothetical protein n=1 Tax=Cellulomonas persica TaxID=76861 RepID=UPI001649CF7E|nr:hypothetical protein [Cellulomonas persica]